MISIPYAKSLLNNRKPLIQLKSVRFSDHDGHFGAIIG